MSDFIKKAIESFRKEFTEELNASDEKWIPEKVSIIFIKEDASIVEVEFWLSKTLVDYGDKVREETLEEVKNMIKLEKLNPKDYYYDNIMVRNKVKRHLLNKLSSLQKGEKGK